MGIGDFIPEEISKKMESLVQTGEALQNQWNLNNSDYKFSMRHLFLTPVKSILDMADNSGAFFNKTMDKILDNEGTRAQRYYPSELSSYEWIFNDGKHLKDEPISAGWENVKKGMQKIGNDDVGSGAVDIAQGVLQAGPSLIGETLGTMGVGKLFGLGSLFALQSTATANRIAEEHNLNSTGEGLGAAYLGGAGSALLDTFSTGRMLKGAGSSRIINSLENAGIEGVTEGAQEYIEGLGDVSRQLLYSTKDVDLMEALKQNLSDNALDMGASAILGGVAGGAIGAVTTPEDIAKKRYQENMLREHLENLTSQGDLNNLAKPLTQSNTFSEEGYKYFNELKDLVENKSSEEAYQKFKTDIVNNKFNDTNMNSLDIQEIFNTITSLKDSEGNPYLFESQINNINEIKDLMLKYGKTKNITKIEDYEQFLSPEEIKDIDFMYQEGASDNYALDSNNKIVTNPNYTRSFPDILIDTIDSDNASGKDLVKANLFTKAFSDPEVALEKLQTVSDLVRADDLNSTLDFEVTLLNTIDKFTTNNVDEMESAISYFKEQGYLKNSYTVSENNGVPVITRDIGSLEAMNEEDVEIARTSKNVFGEVIKNSSNNFSEIIKSNFNKNDMDVSVKNKIIEMLNKKDITKEDEDQFAQYQSTNKEAFEKAVKDMSDEAIKVASDLSSNIKFGSSKDTLEDEDPTIQNNKKFDGNTKHVINNYIKAYIDTLNDSYTSSSRKTSAQKIFSDEVTAQGITNKPVTLKSIAQIKSTLQKSKEYLNNAGSKMSTKVLNLVQAEIELLEHLVKLNVDNTDIISTINTAITGSKPSFTKQQVIKKEISDNSLITPKAVNTIKIDQMPSKGENTVITSFTKNVKESVVNKAKNITISTAGIDLKTLKSKNPNIPIEDNVNTHLKNKSHYVFQNYGHNTSNYAKPLIGFLTTVAFGKATIETEHFDDKGINVLTDPKYPIVAVFKNNKQSLKTERPVKAIEHIVVTTIDPDSISSIKKLLKENLDGLLKEDITDLQNKIISLNDYVKLINGISTEIHKEESIADTLNSKLSSIRVQDEASGTDLRKQLNDSLINFLEKLQDNGITFPTEESVIDIVVTASKTTKKSDDLLENLKSTGDKSTHTIKIALSNLSTQTIDGEKVLLYKSKDTDTPKAIYDILAATKVIKEIKFNENITKSKIDNIKELADDLRININKYADLKKLSYDSSTKDWLKLKHNSPFNTNKNSLKGVFESKLEQITDENVKNKIAGILDIIENIAKGVHKQTSTGTVTIDGKEVSFNSVFNEFINYDPNDIKLQVPQTAFNDINTFIKDGLPTLLGTKDPITNEIRFDPIYKEVIALGSILFHQNYMTSLANSNSTDDVFTDTIQGIVEGNLAKQNRILKDISKLGLTTFRNKAVSRLGKDLYDFLGLKVKDSADKDFEEAFQQMLGFSSIYHQKHIGEITKEMVEKANLMVKNKSKKNFKEALSAVINTTYEGKTQPLFFEIKLSTADIGKTKKKSIKKAKKDGYKKPYSKTKDSTTTTTEPVEENYEDVRYYRVTKGDESISMLMVNPNKDKDKLKADREGSKQILDPFMDELFAHTSYEGKTVKNKPTENIFDANKRVGTLDQTASTTQQDTINLLNSKPVYIKRHIANMFQLDGIVDTLVDILETYDVETTNINLKASIEDNRAYLKTYIEQFKNFMDNDEKVGWFDKDTNEIKATKFFYEHTNKNNNRAYIENQIGNYQLFKFVRELMSTSANINTIDYVSKSRLYGTLIDSSKFTNFVNNPRNKAVKTSILGIGAGLGIKINNMSESEALLNTYKEINKVLESDVGKKILEKIKTIKDLQEWQEYQNKELMENILELVKTFGGVPAINPLVTLFRNIYSGKTSKKFRDFHTLEIDSSASGATISSLMYASSPENLQRIMKLTRITPHTPYSEKVEIDFYTQIQTNIYTLMNISDVTPEIKKASEAMLKLLFDETELDRSLAKDPTMRSVYGAGIEGIAEGFIRAVIDKKYTNIQKIHKKLYENPRVRLSSKEIDQLKGYIKFLQDMKIYPKISTNLIEDYDKISYSVQENNNLLNIVKELNNTELPEAKLSKYINSNRKKIAVVFETAFTKNFGDVYTAKNAIQEITTQTVNFYKRIFEKKLEEFSQKNKNKSRQTVEEVVKELNDIAPKILMGQSDIDNKNTYMPLYKLEADYANNTIRITMATNTDGKIKERILTPITKTTIPDVTGAGVVSIHAVDSNQVINALNALYKQDEFKINETIGQVYDAYVLSSSKAHLASPTVNKAFFETIFKQNVLFSALNMYENVLKQYPKYEHLLEDNNPLNSTSEAILKGKLLHNNILNTMKQLYEDQSKGTGIFQTIEVNNIPITRNTGGFVFNKNTNKDLLKNLKNLIDNAQYFKVDLTDISDNIVDKIDIYNDNIIHHFLNSNIKHYSSDIVANGKIVEDLKEKLEKIYTLVKNKKILNEHLVRTYNSNLDLQKDSYTKLKIAKYRDNKQAKFKGIIINETVRLSDLISVKKDPKFMKELSAAFKLLSPDTNWEIDTNDTLQDIARKIYNKSLVTSTVSEEEYGLILLAIFGVNSEKIYKDTSVDVPNKDNKPGNFNKAFTSIYRLFQNDIFNRDIQKIRENKSEYFEDFINHPGLLYIENYIEENFGVYEENNGAKLDQENIDSIREFLSDENPSKRIYVQGKYSDNTVEMIEVLKNEKIKDENNFNILLEDYNYKTLRTLLGEFYGIHKDLGDAVRHKIDQLSGHTLNLLPQYHNIKFFTPPAFKKYSIAYSENTLRFDTIIYEYKKDGKKYTNNFNVKESRSIGDILGLTQSNNTDNKYAPLKDLLEVSALGEMKIIPLTEDNITSSKIYKHLAAKLKENFSIDSKELDSFIIKHFFEQKDKYYEFKTDFLNYRGVKGTVKLAPKGKTGKSFTSNKISKKSKYISVENLPDSIKLMHKDKLNEIQSRVIGARGTVKTAKIFSKDTKPNAKFIDYLLAKSADVFYRSSNEDYSDLKGKIEKLSPELFRNTLNNMYNKGNAQTKELIDNLRDILEDNLIPLLKQGLIKQQIVHYNNLITGGVFNSSTNTITVNINPDLVVSEQLNGQSELETYIHEFLHTITYMGLKNDITSRVQVEKLYKEFMKTPNLKDKIIAETASLYNLRENDPLVVAHADKLYKYLFNNPTHHNLDEFLTHVMTNPIISKIAKDTYTTKDEKKSFWTKVIDFFKNLFNKVLANPNANDSIYNQMLVLTNKIAKLNAKYSAPKSDFIFGEEIEPSQNTKDLYGLFVQLHTVPPATSLLNKYKDSKVLHKMYNFVTSRTTQDYWNNITNFSNHKEMLSLFRSAKYNLEKVKEYRYGRVKSVVNELFDNNLTKKDKEDLKQVILDTDIYNLAQINANGKHIILTALESDNVLKSYIKKYENTRFEESDDYHSYLKAYAKALAYYNIHKEAKLPFLSQNITSLVTGQYLPEDVRTRIIPTEFYFNSEKVNYKKLDEMSEKVSTLTSFYTLSMLPVEQRQRVHKLLSENQNNALGDLLKTIGFIKQTREGFFKGKVKYIEFGNYGQVFSDNRKVLYIKKSEIDSYRKQGYTVEKLNEKLNGLFEKELYVAHMTNIELDWNKGILDTFNVNILPNTNNVIQTEGTKLLYSPEELAKSHSSLVNKESFDIILNHSLEDDFENYVIPTYGNGKLNRYNISLPTKYRKIYLNEINEIDEILGREFTTTFNRIESNKSNEKLFQALADDYNQAKENGTTYEFIDIEKNYPEQFALIPEYLRLPYEKKGLYVRESLVHFIFGYRDLSITNLTFIENAIKKYPSLKGTLLLGEKIWKDTVTLSKTNIVMKLFETVMANVMSNAVFLINKGIPPHKTLAYLIEGYVAIDKYNKDLREKDRITLMEEVDEDKIAYLENEININPIAVLIDAGLHQVIIEDVNEKEDNEILKYIDKKYNKGKRPMLDNLISWVFLTKDNPLQKKIIKLQQTSDLIARYALYKYKTEDLKQDFNKQMVYDLESDFINYSLLLPQNLKYIEDIGLFNYSKYFLQIQKIIFQTMYDHPVKTATGLLVGNALLDSMIPNIYSGSMLNIGNKINNPLTHISEVITPAMYDNTLSIF